jgi:hypothetical protein
MRYTPQVLQNYSGEPKEIFLTYIAPYHYNAIRRRTRNLPRVFSLGRTQSDIELALIKAEQQGFSSENFGNSLMNTPAGVPETVFESSSQRTNAA